MKLKYYMRGIGIGIIVTACIFLVNPKTEKLTDAQIKMRALELGMVEKTVLTDLEEEPSPVDNSIQEMDKQTESVASDANEKVAGREELPGETTDTEKVEDAEETVNKEESETEIKKEDIQAEDGIIAEKTEGLEEKNEEPVETEIIESYIVIVVEKGNGSENVSQKLYEAGLVNSAAEYNRFLVENGYDRRLSIGNHEIPVSASEEEMAKILCGIK